MGNWRISADLLAASRFTVSPLQETVGALYLLDAERGRPLEPWNRTFQAAHQEAFTAMLAAHPARAELLRWSRRPPRGGRPGWTADFLTPAPPHDHPTFDDELEALDAWSEADIRAELEHLQGRALPARLRRADLAHEARELLRWVWTRTLSTDWARRERVLEADIVSRTARLASRGWARVLQDLHPGTRWVGEGHLRINTFDLPTRDLRQAEQLFLVPVHGPGRWFAWTAPTSYAIVYPVTGVLAPPQRTTADGLARLIGANRAGLLRALDVPRGTTQLATLSGLPVGSVGNHLRVLLDSGAVLRRRSGREVRYWRSPLGDALCVSGEPSDA